jgi:hypothetical protein
MGEKITLHSIETGKRLCQNAKPQDVKFKSYNTWRARFLLAPHGVGLFMRSP